MARHVDTPGVLHTNTFPADVPVVSEPVKHSPAASVSSCEHWTGPPDPHPFMPPPVTRSFADHIASTGFTVEAPDEPPVAMNTLSTIEEPESATGYAISDSNDEGYPAEQPPASQPPPRFGCGRSIPGLGRSLLTSSLVCALLCIVCAAAAPLTVSGAGGVGAHAYAVPPVGGAGRTDSSDPITATLPPGGSPIQCWPLGELSPDVTPPRRHGRHRARQGFWLIPYYGYIPTHPPSPPLDGAPPSPGYSPGPTTDAEEGEEPSSIDIAYCIPSICATKDSPPETCSSR
ncbi:hypothetical protein CYMTET_21789 [Cymbomonas tetramitiformis]|uniref:Uncharacterized protein n=1 Tax=Cymbomonas tetramitiformis TaxID=36881 RepID=A0AAE0G161_9CHLO|nr:hypothetical protein CYMTET_21789 [Cymbomonas tetramitiformis]